MRKQGREEQNPMQIYPQATKINTITVMPPTVKTTLKSHWYIRGVKGLWKFVAVTSPGSDLVEPKEMIAWFYPSWSGTSVKVNYGRFVRDKELEDVLKRLL